MRPSSKLQLLHPKTVISLPRKQSLYLQSWIEGLWDKQKALIRAIYNEDKDISSRFFFLFYTRSAPGTHTVHIVSLFEHNVLVKDIQYTTSPPVSLYILTQRSVSGFLHPRPTSQLIGKPPITDPFITNNNSYSDNWIEHYSALMEFEAMVKFNSQRLPIQYEINHFDSNRTYPSLPCEYWVRIENSHWWSWSADMCYQS